ncbi:MAG: DUF1559 domain-containing protein [Planctomycetaceae bacterium]
MKTTTIAAAGLLLLCSTAWADDPPAEEKPKPVELLISPKAIETPLFKYRLLPTEPELKPGNAVPIILRLPWENWDFFGKENLEVREQLSRNKWEDMPLDSPEWNDFPKNRILPDYFFFELKRAAFRRDADWEYPLQEVPAYHIRLPDLQGARELFRGLSARSRHHLSQGELDHAHECIVVGLAVARHQARSPFYIIQLVSAAELSFMLNRVAEVIAQPDSPNLYWALTVLPAPFLNVRGAAEFESRAFALTFPAANDLDRERTEQEWKELHEQLMLFLRLTEKEPEDETMDRITKLGKEALRGIDRHVTDEEARVRWIGAAWMRISERQWAIMCLPPREAWPLLEKFQLEMERLESETAGLAWGGFREPYNLYLALYGPDRRIQALRVIEAVRHHLATHDGKLPARLEDITDIPVPLDPWTGTPFEWHVEGNTATLKAPPLPVGIAPRSGNQFRPEMIDFRLTVRTDLHRLQGAWKLQSSRRRGEAEAAEPSVPTHRFTFSDNKVEYETDSTLRDGTLKLDQSASPRAIDLRFDSHTLHAIYRFDGDKLRIAHGPGQRPKSFAVDEREPHKVVWTFERPRGEKLPATRSDIEWAEMHQARLRAGANMERLVMALHQYHADHGHFPLPATRDAQGKSLLSWRVAVLPYLGENEKKLFDEFRQSEPWDSEHNRKLLPSMPKVFASVREPSKVPHGTFYQAFVGPGAIFEEGEEIAISKITDGTTNTIALVAAAEAVPWTKPADVEVAPDKPLPKFAGGMIDDGLVTFAFANGSVKTVSRWLDEDSLRACILRDDGGGSCELSTVDR